MNNKYGVLYGFKKEAQSVVGYLRIMPEGKRGSNGQYDIVEEEDQASKFPKTAKNGWDAVKICNFMNSEEELAEWQFHVVWRNKDVANNSLLA